MAAGYAVYVVDRPGHGRSPHHPDVLGPTTAPFTYEFAQMLFIGDDEGHTQWVGEGGIGNPLVDQLLSSTGPMLVDSPEGHALDGDRLSRLLDVIGPAVVMSHSAGGPAGWLVADARPESVRALVAVEPMGPPFNPMFGPGRTSSP